jgi:opacity protein-like surface antigen
MSAPIRTLRTRFAVALMLGLAWACHADAEPYAAGYAGVAITEDKDLRTELELDGAPLVNGRAHDLSFDTAAIFGGKGGYFLERPLLGGHLGAELDVYHYRPDVGEQRVRFTGLLGGVNGDTSTRVQAADIEITAVTLNLLYRFRLAPEPQYPHGRLQPYVGVGGGAFIARLSTTTSALDVNKDVADTDVRPGIQVLAGGRWLLTRHIALFAEYKFLQTQTFSFTFKESGTRGGVPVTETVRDRAAATSHLFYGGIGFHW